MSKSKDKSRLKNSVFQTHFPRSAFRKIVAIQGQQGPYYEIEFNDGSTIMRGYGSYSLRQVLWYKDEYFTDNYNEEL